MKKINFDKLNGTPFQLAVWRALTMIPRGQTVNYKRLAEMAGYPNAVRAVANAVGKNPMAPTIPCHRVIRSDGSIGGYSGSGGVKAKKKLLEQEK
ncbi:MAG: MGMT family protein [Alphaproteobacteria bacterium]|nr:MGMT family protein [Alphaproteobacteria bacterium]MBN2674895.1 MGMT family protein [Alphaproteobacteria bacterium]